MTLPLRPALGLLVACMLLAGCGDRDTAGERGDASAETGSLPVPEGARGGVTGMPDEPGPGEIGPPDTLPSELPPDTMVDSDGNVIAPGDVAVGDGTDGTPGNVMPGEPGSGEPQAFPDEPGPQDAVAVVRNYYGAINEGSFAQAYRLWSDGGRASGQSPQQFADGFANTAGVSVEIMPPGRIDAAAGSRYIEVPVAVTGTQRDGSTRRYVGAYVLRRAVVDGATPEQRAWRITSADIREVQQ